MSESEVRATLRAAAEALAVSSLAYQQFLARQQTEDAKGDEPLRASNVKQCIELAAPAPTEMPVSMRKLAVRSGYSYTQWFRQNVRELIASGVLEEDGWRAGEAEGVRRAAYCRACALAYARPRQAIRGVDNEIMMV